MKTKGVLYDVGRELGGWNWRPDYSPELVRRELEIIKGGLHCTAVKICSRDIGRLSLAAQYALELGLDVWFCPELWNKPPGTTLRHITRAASAAEQLRARWPGRLVFSVGTELTLYLRGILDGRTLSQRVSRVNSALFRSGTLDQPLNAFLGRASQSAREVFRGPVSYSSLPVENVDWSMFDIIGIDHYLYQSEDRYLQTLEPLLAAGKPVVITEFGFRTRTGADRTSPDGVQHIEPVSFVLHQVPVVGRLVRPRLKVVPERNEDLQARCLTRQLELLDSAGVDGAFVYTFTMPLFPHADDPVHDLDADDFSLVKSRPRGRPGAAYPDLPWDPKLSFTAVGDYYATHS